MSNILARIFYRKKVKRFENLTNALLMIGERNYREATRLLNEVKPTEYMEDIGLYYFVAGRLALDFGELEKADIHLSTAWNLGFRRPSLFVSLGLARARLGRLSDARELLSIAMSDGNESEEDDNIVKQLLVLIDKLSSGEGIARINELVSSGMKKFRGSSKGDKIKKSELKKAFTQSLESLDENDPEQTDIVFALLGEYLRINYNGNWIFGLELEDHSILINGVSFSVKHVLAGYKSGTVTLEELDKISLSSSLSGVFLDETGNVSSTG
ncbi:MAG: hypothetical protein JXR95_05640 [Deltaproteobacteria bacterium]|nr:hypothetical protein [Deltaproteobacteria bacterium]